MEIVLGAKIRIVLRRSLLVTKSLVPVRKTGLQLICVIVLLASFGRFCILRIKIKNYWWGFLEIKVIACEGGGGSENQ